MKRVLVSLVILFSIQHPFAQNKVSKLPTGTYQTYFYGFNYSLNKWLRGDIVLLSPTTYKLSNEKETGNYKFDQEKQRVYFLSGPLKNVFAKTAVSSDKPAIVFPKKENLEKNIKLAVSDVWANYKKK